MSVQIVFGPLPPPYGGVSVFVERHVAQLVASGIQTELIQWPRLSRWEKFKTFAHIISTREELSIEINEYLTTPILITLLRPFKTNISHWIHSGQFTDRLPLWRKRIYNAFLKRVGDCVFVSGHIIGMFRRNDVHVPTASRIKNAFLPPDTNTEARILATYPRDIKEFIRDRSPLLVMQGGDAFHEGVDRYGSDIALQMSKTLVAEFPNLGLLVGRPSVGDAQAQEYFAKLDQFVIDHKLGDNIKFLTGERELWPITARATAFLRPSNQDGDSISVREALWLDTPVIASNACPRPREAHIFENRNVEDFVAVLKEFLTREVGIRESVGRDH